MRRRLAALALLSLALVAGPARSFEPEFVPGRVISWPGGNSTYRVNAASFTSAGLDDGVVTASFAAWSEDPLAALTLTRGSNLAEPTGIEESRDFINEIEFLTTGWDLGSGVLGVTFVYFDDANDLLESDMYMNGEDFDWDDPTGAGCTSRFDLGSTVTHEAGHFIGLGHSSESDATCNPGSPQFDAVLCDATMYYSGGPCDTTGQSLECDDRAGLRFIYPPGGSRRADWSAAAFASQPAPGSVDAGTAIAVSGTARNTGSLDTQSGVAAAYVTSQAGSIAGGTRITPTDALGILGPCRSEPVSLSVTFTPDQAGTRWIVVKLDDTTTTAEYDETDTSNLASIGPFSVGVTGPILVVDPVALEFDAAVGGGSPAGQAVAITNGGSGTFTWNASDDRPWISLSRASGAPGQGFDVLVNPAGLSAGRHEGTVTVSASGAAGSPTTIAVGLDVTAGAILSVAPTSLTFEASPGGALPAMQQLGIANDGSGSMAWSVSDDATWMSVAPGSGTDDGSVTVSVTTTALPAGTRQGTVTVTATGAAGSPRSIPITYVLSDNPPMLEVAPASLTFSGGAGGPAPSSQSLAVTNGGGGTLSFTAAANRSWLAVSPGSGNAPEDLVVSVDTTGLSPGTFTGTVTVTSAGTDGSPKAVPVILELTTQPSLGVAPGSLTFTTPAGSSPASRTLTVTNDGSGTLTESVTDDAAWLSVSPSGATLSSGASRQHVVSVDATGLPEGTHQATITVSAPMANDSPVTVPVTLEVGARPPLVVTPATLSFTASPGAPPPGQSLGIGTSGATTAAWTATSDAPWLTVVPAQGTGDGSVTVRASASGLSAGTRTGHVTVTAPALAGSPQVVDVSFTVQPGPRLSATPTSVRWRADAGGSVPAAQVLEITNLGTGTLAWSIAGAPPWLSVTPASGSGPASVSLAPTTTDLPPGPNVATLLVSATGAYDSPVAIDLQYDIVAPGIVLDPPRVRLEPSDPLAPWDGGVQVGGAPGQAWTAASTVPWLTVQPTSGSSGDFFIVSIVDRSRLKPGLHEGSVIVTSPGAANSPAPLPVAVVVRQDAAGTIVSDIGEMLVRSDGGVQVAGRILVDDASDQDVAWSLGSRPPWLIPSQETGTTGDRIDVSVDPAGLAPGLHDGPVYLFAAGRHDLFARVEVLADSRLVAEPGALALRARAGGISSIETVSISNVGTGAGQFVVESSSPWLGVVGPVADTPPATVQVRADASALAVGTHRATLTIRPSSGQSASVPVTVTVAPAGSPIASIQASVESGCAPLSIELTDASVGATSRTWMLPDGTTSSQSPLTLVLDQPGDHVVTLAATNASGTSSATTTLAVRQPPLAFAGVDRWVVFEASGTTRVALETARTAAAAPARIASRAWTTDTGVFEDTGTATSALERPALLLASARGGVSATLTLEVVDDTGCSASDSARIHVRADVDLDGDGREDLTDNCPGIANASQADADGDGVGSRCDACPNEFDPSNADADGDGVGDACQTAGPPLALATILGRACDLAGFVPASIASPGRARRVVVTLTDRFPDWAEARGAAEAAGGQGRLHSTDRHAVDLRVPAGVRLDGEALAIGLALSPADDIVPVACASARISWAGGVLDFPCTDGEIRLRPDADVAPSGGNGVTDIADVVRMLRASVQLETFTDDEQLHADVAPGSTLPGTITWRATPDCRIDIADVVVALRTVVGLVTLPR